MEDHEKAKDQLIKEDSKIQEKDSQHKLSELRTRSEEIVRSGSLDQEDISARSSEEIQRLIHELRVHQIELELQNEELRQAQLKLEDMKDKYLNLYDFAPAGYVNLNDKGLILEANLTVTQLLGLERTSLIKMFFSQFVCKEFGDAFYLYLRQVFESQSKQTCEIKLTREDGTVFHAQLDSVAVQDESGQCTHCRTILSDVTERTQMEQNLRERERKYRTLLDNAPIGILVSDTQGNILEVNDACLEVLGSPGPEATKSINMLTFPPLMEAGVSGAFSKCMAETRVITHDTAYISNWGKKSHLRIILAPVLNEEGSVAGCQAVIEDITEGKRAEEEIKKNREKFRIAADFTYDWGYWIDMNGTFVYMSPSCERITGYSREEFLDNPSLFETIVHPDDKELVNDHMKSFREGKLPDVCVIEFRIIDTTGEVHWIEHVCQNVVGSTGTRLGRRASQRDITKRVQAEEALRSSELRYRRLFESAQEGILRLDFDTGKILDVNQYLIDMLGYSHEDFLGKHVWEVSPFKDTALNKAAFLELQEHGYIRYEDLPLETRDGRRIDVEFVTNSYLVNGKKFVQCNIRDITGRKLMEKSLRESEKMKSMVLDNTQEIFFCLDKDMHILWANKASGESLNLSTEALVGKHCFETWPGRTEPCEACPALRAMETGLPQYGSEISTPDGRYWSRRGYPVFDAKGKVEGATELLVNITARIKAEQEREQLRLQFLQAQKMEAVGTLASGVAHDFNNILQVVFGYCDMLLMNKKSDDPESESIRKIQASAKRGATLVQSLMAFSRKGDSKPRPLNLSHTVTQTKSLLERTIPKMISIELDVEDNVAVVAADPSQIEQILINLAINAKDAMPQEGGRLTIETKNVTLDDDYCTLHVGARPGPHVMLSVSDTGCGMSQETLQHIFEPFFTTKEAGKGTGLGLAMVYGIVKQHEAHLVCYSRPGKGTTFRIYFPVVPTEQDENVEQDSSMPTGGSETVFLVDDDEVIIEVGSEVLTGIGYTVLTATTGKEALEIYRKHQTEISLVILDKVMPEMGGIQCFQELVKINPNVRVIISTGLLANGTVKDAADLGARGFVQKPWDARTFLHMVRRVLDEG